MDKKHPFIRNCASKKTQAQRKTGRSLNDRRPKKTSVPPPLVCKGDLQRRLALIESLKEDVARENERRILQQELDQTTRRVLDQFAALEHDTALYDRMILFCRQQGYGAILARNNLCLSSERPTHNLLSRLLQIQSGNKTQ